MSSSKIEELKKRREKEQSEKKSQILYGIILVILTIMIYILFLFFDFEKSKFWIIGLAIGVVLQRSRFCFTAGFRDPILVGNTSIMKAIIIGLIIATVGFGIIQYIEIGNSQVLNIDKIPGQIYPVGLHTAMGALIFGIGMVIAGGCGSGTLMRIGEGFKLQIVVLIGLIIGTVLGAKHYEFWDKAIISKTQVVYIPEYTGLPLAIISQVIILIILYIFADWYDKKNNIMSM
ncbi:YeeE/YedE thiosulfate transporter family protein [Caldisalinibacter kiritimatiensis]|uniref:YeeE/YedE-like protein n=1 Tax=Caldisalinibacter kiritimatiensis TaxID=1304284 RepID=R1CS79_9FIRM|nr:YeeE/YedE thiosulfate transporter family protein [Caldisalinibacter kiritimatiensis]EOC99558.1 YeeE/YedE-like protein [Caldisalinibacter kiritimatiensis]